MFIFDIFVIGSAVMQCTLLPSCSSCVVHMIDYNVKLHSQCTRLAMPVPREGCASVQSDHVLVIAAHPWPLGHKSGGKQNPAVTSAKVPKSSRYLAYISDTAITGMF
jgi:hypothetical protein